MKRWRALATCTAALLPLGAHAVRAPIRHFAATDGFAESRVNRLRIDPSGVVWIAGGSGLWEFDGERFGAPGPADGLPRTEIQDIALARDGTLWVATDEGLFHGDPSRATAAPAFSPVEFAGREAGTQPSPFRLLAARDGTIWIGTRHGLWRVPASDPQETVRPRAVRIEGVPERGRVTSLAEGPDGAIWVGTHVSGIYRVARDGRVDHHADDGPGYGFVSDIFFDDEGAVWTAFLGGVAHFTGDPLATSCPRPAFLGPSDGVSISPTGFLRIDRDRFLIGTLAGIVRLRRDPVRGWIADEVLDRSSGLPDAAVQAIASDGEGSLWIGMYYGGLAKRVAGGFLRHDEVAAQGSIIVGVAGDRGGHVAVLTRDVTMVALYTDARGMLVRRRLELPLKAGLAGWRTAEQFAADPAGGWWIGGSEGLLHFPGTPIRSPEAPLGPDALPPAARDLARLEAAAVFVAASGALWIGSAREDSDSSAVSCWYPAEAPRTFPVSSVGTRAVAYYFAEDAAHDIWIAFEDGRMARYRDGVFEPRAAPVFPLAEAPFFVDRSGSLWVLGRGLAVCVDPSAAEPVFERQPLPSGFTDLAMTCATQDRDGRLYFGSARGVLRLDRATGATRLFTAEDGLPEGEIRYAFRDALDRLWFADAIGLAQLTPGPHPPAIEAPARIRSLAVAGVPQRVPLFGATRIGPFTLRPEERTLRIDYFAVHHGPGAPPQFRTKLEGADANWSAPTDGRSVLYSNLAPGDYRFLVTSTSAPSAPPTVVAFRVPLPFFKRGWFLALVAALVLASAFGTYRVRVAQLLAIERLRTRIATDLHDEVGSSLSQIAVLSQVAEQSCFGREGAVPQALSRITDLSGDLVDAMSDTVWAISRREDRLSDLVHRMRRFGSDLFVEGVTTVQFDLPEAESEERLDPDVRRAIYLVFKESLHNVRKHADARSVRVSLERLEGGFRLTVSDDGRGFDVSPISPGHGLASMCARAEALGGRLSIEPHPGRGTTVVLHIVRPRRSLSRWIVWRRRDRV